MKNVTVRYGQTLVDIAVQELGDAERAYELALINGLSLSEDLEAGSVVWVPEFERSKRGVVQLFSNPANAPASADTEEAFKKPEGIGYWYLENDFVVT